MDTKIREIARRLRGMREVLEVPEAEMAAATGVSCDEYRALEDGEKDFSFTFLYRAAQRFNIDLTDLLTGESPHRSGYTLIRKGEGLPIERRAGFRYLNLAPFFRGRMAEPFHVTAPAQPDAQTCQIALSSHAGQEMDYILSGALRVHIDGHEEILYAGDSLYYDSGRPHGMVALNGPCQFLAFVIAPEEEPTC
ncbi:MAG: cupin domain-containing protein [Clostridiales bacterium]|nr:cupin domain-containing protein [Clostridiales bacterium]